MARETATAALVVDWLMWKVENADSNEIIGSTLAWRTMVEILAATFLFARTQLSRVAFGSRHLRHQCSRSVGMCTVSSRAAQNKSCIADRDVVRIGLGSMMEDDRQVGARSVGVDCTLIVA